MPIPMDRVFTTEDSEGPYLKTGVKEVEREAKLQNAKGETIFEQSPVYFPEEWSQQAINITASKYFYGQLGDKMRENSLRQVVSRIVNWIGDRGLSQSYFDHKGRDVFVDELAYVLVNQMAAFNSPVWFNIGTWAAPVSSACFINSVEDSMESILDLVKIEGMIFKGGSGSGVNYSKIRGSMEPLSGGGTASGPLSFIKSLDTSSGSIKSGGRTRRAARMVILDVDHPDILEFITCKVREEEKARILIRAGLDPSIDGEAYGTVQFQNANNTVRVTDEFMRAVLDDKPWNLKERTTDNYHHVRASHLLDKIAESAHICGDPGIQFHDTVNRWNTCSETTVITGTNPCSEFVFIDDSACNLSSINLVKFLRPEGFDYAKFVKVVRLMIIAQDILVDASEYPTDEIRKNSVRYRPLGLGYSNLGGLLMRMGVPYHSDRACAFAAQITSAMTAWAYSASAELAKYLGTFDYYEDNALSVRRVIDQHAEAAEDLEVADTIWPSVRVEVKKHGLRNAQVTLLAPCGTIGMLMDCDTTGIEPELGLIRYKSLVGGGHLTIQSASIEPGLISLDYDEYERAAILEHIKEKGTIEGSDLLPEHLPVFDCSMKAPGGTRVLSPEAHMNMLVAVQPFLSGSISKTLSLPRETTPEEIRRLYIKAWELGLKSLTVYRDGSKSVQPISLGKEECEEKEKGHECKVIRRHMPDNRESITHKFSIAGHKGYLTVGKYEDGSPGELFVRMAKAGSVVGGFVDAFALAISLAMQYGVPLEVMVEKFAHTRFEPSGFTVNPQIPVAKSIPDYIFRWMEGWFGVGEQVSGNLPPQLEMTLPKTSNSSPPCPGCGGLMERSGSCYRCVNCGDTSGCS